MRWKLYRLLVSYNGTRFYGKKGEGLNLLQRQRSKSAPLLIPEIKDYELESKLELHTSDFIRIHDVFTLLYVHFNQPDKVGFRVTPKFPFINSQSTISTYLYDPKNPDREGKILVGLQAKYSQKQHIATYNGVFIREEQKGKKFPFERRKIKQLIQESGLTKAGTTLRIRRAFYVTSSDGRVFKISLDFNWLLPRLNNDFFSQIEVEYTGKYT